MRFFLIKLKQYFLPIENKKILLFSFSFFLKAGPMSLEMYSVCATFYDATLLSISKYINYLLRYFAHSLDKTTFLILVIENLYTEKFPC